MAAAVSALLNHEVERIVLTRPAVEAGEALGFLPGDLREKILPYLRPLYDALHDMLDPEEVVKLTEKGIIEIAPLAYMRGRTLSRAFVVLDEAQNTTPEQMMMFLTRLGEDSRMVVTGDVTQIDLPRSKLSGLLEVRHILRGRARGSSSTPSRAADVVRHPLVQRIIEAYDRYKNPMAGAAPAGAALTCPSATSSGCSSGGSAPARATPGPPPSSGFREFLDRSRLVAGLIFIVTVAAIVVVSSAGMRVLDLPVLPNQIAPVRIVAGRPLHLRERREDPRARGSSSLTRAAPDLPARHGAARALPGGRARPPREAGRVRGRRTPTRRPSSSTGARRSAPSPRSSTCAAPTRRTRTTWPRS